MAKAGTSKLPYEGSNPSRSNKKEIQLMDTNTTFVKYSLEENKKMFKQVKDFHDIFEEVSRIIKEAKTTKVKPVTDTSRDNCIWINPKIKADFIKNLEVVAPIDEVINKYEEWFDELYKLVIVNQEWLHHPKVMNHITEIYAICASLQPIIDKAKVGIPES